MAKVYISSTYSDLEAYREAVYRALRQMRHDVIAMEDYVATDQRPLDRCLDDVAACDLYVGIFAWRYGYIPEEDNPDQKSITELEYRKAGEMGKTRLIFLLDPEVPWHRHWTDDVTGEGDKGERIADFRQELGEEKLVSFFKTLDELARLVSTAVHNWEKETRQKEKLAIDAADEHVPPVATAAPQPREVAHHVFLAYAGMDKEFAAQLERQLRLQGRSLLPSFRALFAEQETDFQRLENQVRQCHTAIILLSDILLEQMEKQPHRTRRILRILQSRTGHTIALCSTENSLKCAREWGFSQVVDVSSWEPESDMAHVKEAESARVELVLQIDRAILAGCPAGPARTVGLPFVVVAMTHEEALELHEHPELLEQELGTKTFQNFQELKDALEPYGVSSFVQRYNLTREKWRPFEGSEHTIAMVIEDTAKHLNQTPPPQLRGRRIKIQYYPFDALINKEKELRYIYYEIAQIGCVVLVDEFSMFHPNVRTTFRGSPLFSSRQVALVTISPLDLYGLPPNQVLEGELRQRLEAAFDRFMLDYDPQCEFGVGNEHRLRRWLHASLPETLHILHEPPPDRYSVNRFQEEVGQEPRLDMPSLL